MLKISGPFYLELHDRFGPAIKYGGHELVHHVYICLAAHARVLQADLVRRLQQLLVVRAHVQSDREDSMGRDAARCAVQRKFADRNAHSVSAEIAQAEDATAICNHDDLHIILRPVVHHGLKQAAICGRKIHASGSTELRSKFLANLAYCGSIHYWRQFFNVIDKKTMI